MKSLLLFCALFAFSACHVIPSIPEDNNHYVEGLSRYIWMLNNAGSPQLVDLQASVDIPGNRRGGADNKYFLYTRSNPTSPQEILYNNLQSLQSSNYDPNKPLKVISHGWNNNGNSEVNLELTAAILSAQDVNVVVLDWGGVADSLYVVAASTVPDVGEYLGYFLNWLIASTGGDFNRVHLIGHSLGAHVVGNAGRTVGGRVSRITGLDPAGPLFTVGSEALDSRDGQYVEAIHTDGGILGIFTPVGHADFYPNGGHNPQPGCVLSTCSHGRSYQLMASSIQYNDLVGSTCTDFAQAVSQGCSGLSHHMGNIILTKRGYGIFGLTTGASWPF